MGRSDGNVMFRKRSRKKYTVNFYNGVIYDEEAPHTYPFAICCGIQ